MDNLKTHVFDFVKKYRSDFQLSTMLTSTLSACINIAFLLFNAIFGLFHLSIWHLSVSIYYLFLLCIRTHILVSLKKKRNARPVYIRTHIFLILMNLSMIAPIALMVIGKRDYTYGLTAAIAIAAYTVYRITMAIIQLRKSRKSSSILIKELRIINFVDALMAIITLQNTLIMANNGMTESMKLLCSWTCGFIFSFMLFTIIRSFLLIREKR